MAEITNVTVQPGSDFDQLTSLLGTVLPSFSDLTQDELEMLRLQFSLLSSSDREHWLDILRDRPEKVRSCIDLTATLNRRYSIPLKKVDVLKRSMKITMLEEECEKELMAMLYALVDGVDGYTRFGFSSAPSHITGNRQLGIAGVDGNNRFGIASAPILIIGAGNGGQAIAKQESVRDYPAWFKTLLGINSGVLLSLIAKSTSNNAQSVPTLTIESLAACGAVVGFTTSLAGQYLSTNKPKTLPFGGDPEVLTPKMAIVSGLATACGFAAGVLLLLPNNLFRGITMATAFAAITIPMFIKWCCPISGEAANVPPLKAEAEIPSSGGEDDAADKV
ncbi:hypothetical protein V6N13_040796 [Hibiscus sabdariffa]|uniref:Uncharacterized protein n=1 Tax=Hibiscus sabdariffa TaxID=183260 RepID=A0ABR2R9Y0_9ROSI